LGPLLQKCVKKGKNDVICHNDDVITLTHVFFASTPKTISCANFDPPMTSLKNQSLFQPKINFANDVTCLQHETKIFEIYYDSLQHATFDLFTTSCLGITADKGANLPPSGPLRSKSC